jgi:hypothetical protein|uniref:Uncharacterized protein n=1 Tax=Populus trichocarpa TaxID=3694 RepID=U5FT71_POPTR
MKKKINSFPTKSNLKFRSMNLSFQFMPSVLKIKTQSNKHIIHTQNSSNFITHLNTRSLDQNSNQVKTKHKNH